MIRKLLIPLVLLLLSAGASSQDTLLLFHPTAYNMKLLHDLSQKGLLELEDYHVLGVCHRKENLDTVAAHIWLEEPEAEGFSLTVIEEDLDISSLFVPNACSDHFRKLFTSSRGALFMGGPDIPPAVYHEKAHLLTRVSDPYRHFLELSYLFHLLGGTQNTDHAAWLEGDGDYMISGICLGMQTMVVSTGGSMIQDIPTEIYGLSFAEDILALPPARMHRNYADYLSSGCEQPTSYHFHPIELSDRSFLSKKPAFRSRQPPLVLSSHHQAVELSGDSWEIAARSMDGKIIEAVRHSKYPYVFGVQFHPEKPGLFDPGTVHARSCGEHISFNAEIAASHSYFFHEAYWERISKILRKVRD